MVFFYKIYEKVVSSSLLQYKPGSVKNSDKLCCKMLKKKKFSGLFSIGILRKSSSYVTSYQDTLVMVALCNRADHYIFALWFLSSIYLSFYYSSPNLRTHRLDVYHTSTHGVP